MWQSKLKLSDGDTLELIRTYTKGSWSEEDVSEYQIKNADGEVVGEVVYRDDTSINGMQRRQSVRQTDVNRTVLVNEHWSGD